MARLNLLSGNILVYMLIFCALISCQKPQSPAQIIPESQFDYPQSQVYDESNRFRSYFPLMKEVPTTFTLSANKLSEFDEFFKGFRYSIWFNYESEKLDTFVRINIKINRAFSFINRFENKSYSRFGYNYLESILFIREYTNPDSLAARSIPMVTREACRTLFNVEDSVYLIHSFSHYSNRMDYPYSVQPILQHLFYNHPQKTFIWMTMDTTSNRVIDKETLCSIPDTNTYFVFRFPIPSALQIIQHTIDRMPDLSFIEDSFELKRIYTSITGNIFDWTDTIVSLVKLSNPFPRDSIMDSRIYEDSMMRSVPLPLNIEASVKRFLSEKSYSESVDVFGYLSKPALDLFTIEHAIRFSNKTTGIVLGVKEHKILVLFDDHWQVTDARYMSIFEEILPTYALKYSIGKLMANNDIQILVNEVDAMPSDIWKIMEHKIVSIRKEQVPLTLPFSQLDQYFPYKNVTTFDMEAVSAHYSDMLIFPDSVLACLKESIPYGIFLSSGRNYSITHASNGLTYWFLYGGGELQASVEMMIVDQQNTLRRGSFTVASAGGDEGDYAYSRGWFTNDSTYYMTGKSCSGDIACDSFMHVYHISSNGKINRDFSLSKHYTFSSR